jgi:putative transposon-encoded protein
MIEFIKEVKSRKSYKGIYETGIVYIPKEYIGKKAKITIIV